MNSLYIYFLSAFRTSLVQCSVLKCHKWSACSDSNAFQNIADGLCAAGDADPFYRLRPLIYFSGKTLFMSMPATLQLVTHVKPMGPIPTGAVSNDYTRSVARLLFLFCFLFSEDAITAVNKRLWERVIRGWAWGRGTFWQRSMYVFARSSLCHALVPL